MEQLIKKLELAWELVEYHDDHANIDKVVLYLKAIEATAELIAAKANAMMIDIEIERNE